MHSLWEERTERSFTQLRVRRKKVKKEKRKKVKRCWFNVSGKQIYANPIEIYKNAFRFSFKGHYVCFACSCPKFDSQTQMLLQANLSHGWISSWMCSPKCIICSRNYSYVEFNLYCYGIPLHTCIHTQKHTLPTIEIARSSWIKWKYYKDVYESKHLFS